VDLARLGTNRPPNYRTDGEGDRRRETGIETKIDPTEGGRGVEIGWDNGGG